jgi:hypothetical protein
MRAKLAVLVLGAIAALIVPPSAAAQTAPSGRALKRQVLAQDAAFFKLLFEVCDPPGMTAMLAPDFEMYHDRGGVVAKRATDFISNYAKDCSSWSGPTAMRARRVLVAESVKVYPVPGYGAIEDGFHDFYSHQGSGSETKVGRGRFTQLWRNDSGEWRLVRVFSYDHQDASPKRP